MTGARPILASLFAALLLAACDPCAEVDERLVSGPTVAAPAVGRQAVFLVPDRALGRRLLRSAERDPTRKTELEHRRPLPEGELRVHARATGLSFLSEGGTLRASIGAALTFTDATGAQSRATGRFLLPLTLAPQPPSPAGDDWLVSVYAEHAGRPALEAELPDAGPEGAELLQGVGASLAAALLTGRPLLSVKAPAGAKPDEVRVELRASTWAVELHGALHGRGVPDEPGATPSLAADALLLVAPGALAATLSGDEAPVGSVDGGRVHLLELREGPGGPSLWGIVRAEEGCGWTEVEAPIRAARRGGDPGYRGAAAPRRTGGRAAPGLDGPEPAAAELMRLLEARTRWALLDAVGLQARVGLAGPHEEPLSWELAWPDGARPSTISAPRRPPRGSSRPEGKPPGPEGAR